MVEGGVGRQAGRLWANAPVGPPLTVGSRRVLMNGGLPPVLLTSQASGHGLDWKDLDIHAGMRPMAGRSTPFKCVWGQALVVRNREAQSSKVLADVHGAQKGHWPSSSL